MTDTMHLGLPFIEDSQAQKHVTHNEALRILDAVIQITVADLTRTAPPTSPAAGQRHVVATGATGAWAGHDDAIATWQDGTWVFLAPKTGWGLWSVADASIFIFDGGAWQPLAPPVVPGATVGLLGVNTTASEPNLFSVKSNDALLTAIPVADGGSGDARLQITKEAVGDTASVFFSDTYSGRAEFGLTGDDDFHLKVSADGVSWLDAFVIDTTTGNVAFHGFSDAAVTRASLGLVKQSSSADATADRVMMTGAFGLGGDPIPLSSGDSAIADRPTGFYSCNNSTNTPGAYGWLSVVVATETYRTLEFVDSSTGLRYWGQVLSGTWSGWRLADGRSGSNGTGSWTKLPGGWMQCRQRFIVSPATWGILSWGSIANCGAVSFPAAFSATPTVVAQIIDLDIETRSAYVTYVGANASGVTSMYVASPSTSPPTGDGWAVDLISVGPA